MGRARVRAVGVALVGVLGFSAAAQAQGLTSRPARAEDVRSIDAIVDAFYDVVSRPAGQPVDWARDSTLYLADLRFKIVAPRAESATIGVVDHATYAANNSNFEQGFFEREIHRETNRWGNIAQVFSTYEWRQTPDGPVGGRGINMLELFHDGSRWWIGSAMWMGETAAQPIPAEYLPRR